MLNKTLFATLMSFVVLASTQSSQSASYYFSDCATGGSGTTSDPYCLDPGDDGIAESFDYLMDGTNPELGAGDTVYLGCGVPIGTASCVYSLEGHDGGNGTGFDDGTCGTSLNRACVVFDPEKSGTLESPITITVYCSGGACATVTLSGDSNTNGQYDEGSGSIEPAYMFDNVDNDDADAPPRFPDTCDSGSCGGHDYYTIDGDGALNDNVSRIIIQKVARRCFSFRRGGGGWDVSNVTCRYIGAGPLGASGNQTEGFYPASLAGDGGFHDQGCRIVNGSPGGQGLDAYSAFNFSRMQGAPDNVWNRITFEHSCVGGVRQINNCGGDPEECSGSNAPGRTYLTQWKVQDVFGLGQWHQGRYVYITGWTVEDYFDGLSVEEQMKDVDITDNNIGAPGAWRIHAAGKVTGAIRVTKGDNDSDCDLIDGGGNDCNTQNVQILRNYIWGSNACVSCSSSAPDASHVISGIYWSGSNQAGSCTGCLIENNMIWYIQDSDGNFNLNETPLSVVAEDSITIRNNTIYYSSWPVILSGAAHTFVNNILRKAHGDQDNGGDRIELWIGNSAAGSTVEYNVIAPDGGGNPVSCIDSDDTPTSTTACDTGATAKSCADIASWNIGNICSTPSLVNLSGDKATWNLHLQSTDTVALDAGTTGAADDLDRQSRPEGSAPDIGADEKWTLLLLPPTGDATPNNGTPSPSSPSTHFDKVDEEPNDGATTYISYTGAPKYEVFSHGSSIAPSDTITKVVVRWTQKGSGSTGSKAQVGLRIGSTDSFRTERTLSTTDYVTYEDEWDTDPSTSQAWTKAGVEAALLVHKQTVVHTSLPKPRLTQIVMIVLVE